MTSNTMINLFLSPIFKWLLLLLLLLPSCVLSANESDLYTRCREPFHCGDQTELSYPFWVPGREECGHPDFKLECNTTASPEVTISSVKFKILEANPRITRLARSDYTGQSCLQNSRLNVPFDETVLPFAPGTEMFTVYYDCGGDFPQSLSSFAGKLDCEEDEDERYYLAMSPLNDIPLNTFRVCNKNLSIRTYGQTLNRLQTSPSAENIRMALQEGFELGPNQDCSTCIVNGGACGYNSNGFACYHNNKAADMSKGVIAGIIAGSVLAVAILIAAGVFCVIRKQRKKTQEAQYKSKDLLPVTSYSSRETSTNPTTTTTTSSSYSNHSLVPSISSFANGSGYYGHGVQVFGYEELEEATSNFSRELGDGGFGTVYYGVLKDGRAVAVKRLHERSLKRVEQFKNEIEILKSLKHTNLVILYGCTSRNSRELLLVYEYISNGTLAEHLHGDRAESRPLCWSVRLNVAIETARALWFLHANGIIHRDVKTTNILLDENYQVKVADFGLSRLFPVDQTHVSTAPQGTPGYVDPEYYQCYRLNEKSDVYSFGVVLTELISSKEAVDITRHRHDINLANMAVARIQNDALHELVDPSLGFAKDPEVRRRMMSVAELAFRCLQQERDGRPSMEEIVEILEGIKERNRESPDVVDIEVRGGGDDVGLLRHSVPPPISPETDMWTSSSDRAASF